MKKTLRKINAERKLIDKKLEMLFDCDSDLNILRFISYYNKTKPYIGITPVEEVKNNIISNWQMMNDLFVRRTYLNEIHVLAYGGRLERPNPEDTYTVPVPKFKGFDQITDEIEYVTIAQAITRKKWFENNLSIYLQKILEMTDRITKNYNRSQEDLDKRLIAAVNAQFGPESSQTAKQRIEYQESIRPQYELELIDPLNIRDKITKAIDFVTKYYTEIDSQISRATETTEIDCD